MSCSLRLLPNHLELVIERACCKVYKSTIGWEGNSLRIVTSGVYNVAYRVIGLGRGGDALAIFLIVPGLRHVVCHCDGHLLLRLGEVIKRCCDFDRVDSKSECMRARFDR